MLAILTVSSLLLLAPPAGDAKPAPAADQAPAAAPAADLLTVGSKAPVPEISNFVRGDAPKFFEPGKTYVVEFWATWCGPCRQSMPHLTATAKKFKDKGLVVVGISDEKLEKVTSFLEKPEWQEKAQYILATDPDRSTHKAYMEAAGQNGIPTAFIVKDGTVQWIGHPMEMDAPLEKILDGKWDLATEKIASEKAAQAQAKARAGERALASALDAKDWNRALSLLEEQVKAAPADDQPILQAQRMQVMLMAGRAADGYALAAQVATDKPDLRPLLGQMILRTPDVADRRVDVALGYLQSSLESKDPVHPAILSELAYGYSLKGDYAHAVEYGRRAADAARSYGDDAKDWVADLERQVKEYEAKASGESGDAKSADAKSAETKPAGKS
ncbi:MAG: redoxin family protein [Phycisphaerales bacterium]